MGSVAIFAGSFAKLLKDKILLGSTARILTGAADPTMVATEAERGSIYMRCSLDVSSTLSFTDTASPLFITGAPGTFRMGVLINPTVTAPVTDVKIWTAQGATPTGYGVAEIWSYSGGNVGSLLATSNSVLESNLPTYDQPTWVTFQFTNLSLTAGTPYVLILRQSDTGGLNFLRKGNLGSTLYYSNDGITWTSLSDSSIIFQLTQSAPGASAGMYQKADSGSTTNWVRLDPTDEFTIASVTAGVALLRGGSMYLPDGRIISTWDGIGSNPSDFEVDLSITLASLLDPLFNSDGHLYIDLNSLPSTPTKITGTSLEVYPVTAANFAMLPTNPELSDLTRYVPVSTFLGGVTQPITPISPVSVQPGTLVTGDDYTGTLSPANQTDNAVASNGDWLAVGARAANSTIGRVFVYKRSGSTWTLMQTLNPPVLTAGSNFGNALAMSASWLVIGSFASNNPIVYQLVDGVWTLFQSLTFQNGIASVAIYNDSRIVVGAPSYNTVMLYTYNGSVWSAGTTISGPANSNYFGAALAFLQNGTYLLIGDPSYDGNAGAAPASGAVFPYLWNGSTYTAGSPIYRSGAVSATSNTQFGSSISVSPTGNRFLVGAGLASGISWGTMFNSSFAMIYDFNGLTQPKSVLMLDDTNIVIGRPYLASIYYLNFDGLNWNSTAISGSGTFGDCITTDANAKFLFVGNRTAVSSTGDLQVYTFTAAWNPNSVGNTPRRANPWPVKAVSPISFVLPPQVLGTVGSANQIAGGHVLDSDSFPVAASANMAFWHLSQNLLDSSANVKDFSGSGSPTFAGSGLFGTDFAVTFNAVSSLQRLDSAFFNITGAFTAAGWFNFSTWASGTNQGIMSFGVSADRSWEVYTGTTGILNLAWSTATAGSYDVSKTFTSAVALTGWHHIAVVYTGSEMRLYLDRNLVISQISGAPRAVSAGNATFRVMAGVASGLPFSSANARELVYHRTVAFNQEDIRKLYSYRIDHNRAIAYNNQNWSALRVRFDNEIADQLGDASWLVDKSNSNKLYVDFRDVTNLDIIGIKMADEGFTMRGIIPPRSFDTGYLTSAPTFPLTHSLGDIPTSVTLLYEQVTGSYVQLNAVDYLIWNSTQFTGDAASFALLTINASHKIRIVAAVGSVAIGMSLASLTNTGIVGIGDQHFAGNKWLSGDFNPETDNTFDLGSPSLRWASVHVGPGSLVVHYDAIDTKKMTLGFDGSMAQFLTDAATPMEFTIGANQVGLVGTNGAWTLGVAGFVGNHVINGGLSLTKAIAASNIKPPTQTVYTSGSGTYTTPAGVLWLRVRLVGGGGGGGGAPSGTQGGTGGTTTFGPHSGTGGVGGTGNGNPGNGGTGTLGAGGSGIALNGGIGTGANFSAGAVNAGGGASSPFGGAGGGGDYNGVNVGYGAAANTGSGGGGAAGNASGAAGGGAGGYVDAIIANPAATYSYSVGSGGGQGIGSSYNGGNGGSGLIIIEEHYI